MGRAAGPFERGTRPAGEAVGPAFFGVAWREGWAVVSVRGELDLASAPGLDEHVSQVVRLHVPPLVAVDLSGVEFFDSSGLNALIRAWKRVGTAGGRLVLLRPGPRIAEVLRVTGLAVRFEVRQDLPAAGGGPEER
ncbi:STAS domain-containing protein [Actinomadura sp. 21ATH]|uniref:STAS domain-containing protein n=1 Tax=Actinomadura sp. 21ATH TaxID=1735444 RepID=UPI0035BF5C11